MRSVKIWLKEEREKTTLKNMSDEIWWLENTRLIRAVFKLLGVCIKIVFLPVLIGDAITLMFGQSDKSYKCGCGQRHSITTGLIPVAKMKAWGPYYEPCPHGHKKPE